MSIIHLADVHTLYKQLDRVRYTWVFINVATPTASQDHHIYITSDQAEEQTLAPTIPDDTLAKPQIILVGPYLCVAAVDNLFVPLEAGAQKIYFAWNVTRPRSVCVGTTCLAFSHNGSDTIAYG